ncbi:MAG TPA: hypothetical protein VGD17_02230 [Chitinophagaceae bacterium]
MKPFIRFFIAALSIFVLTGASCKKSRADYAVITGFDTRMCPCCGGLMINFEGETELYEGNYYLITNDPASLGISVNSSFPLYVDVTWELETQGCNTPNPFINITSIKIR